MIRKLIISAAFACFAYAQSLLAAPELADGHPERYTVVKGDTLWDISERFLKSPWLWPEIWHANPQVSNPHLIYPGDIIGLVYIDGKPRITTLKEGPNNGVVKLSPQIKATPISAAIPTIPLEAIASFLSQNRLVEKGELEAAPYVLIGRDNHLITAAGDTVYARGNINGAQKVGIYRPGATYIDPETNELLGFEARNVATAEIDKVDGEVLSVTVIRSSEELRQGDRLLQSEDRTINSTFSPSKPDRDVRGKMIAVDSGVRNIGQYNVVVLNLGSRDGLKEGHVLAAYKDGGLIRDPYTKEKVELPDERAGLLMVFRVFDKLSYGLVLKANRSLAIMDEVRTP